MERYSIVELSHTHLGLECLTVFTKMGHRCGYVGVKRGSPLFGIEYNVDLKKHELLKELKETTIGKRSLIQTVCWDGESTSMDMLFNVHGGVTFSGFRDDGYDELKGIWWIGFDCAHLGDGQDWDKCLEYFPGNETERLKNIHRSFRSHSDIVATKEYVTSECISLAEQIRCVESTYEIRYTDYRYMWE